MSKSGRLLGRDTEPAQLRQAYGRYGEARGGVEAWRTEPAGFERTVPDAARYPIKARRMARREWLRTLNGWIQIALAAATVAVVFGAGFLAGALWELAHWVGKR